MVDSGEKYHLEGIRQRNKAEIANINHNNALERSSRQQGLALQRDELKRREREQTALIKGQADIEKVEKEIASNLQQMGLSHEQQKELIEVHFQAWVNRQNVEEQRFRYEHERDTETKAILHQQYLELQREEQEHQVYLAQVQSTLQQIVEARQAKQEKELAEQTHLQALDLEKLKNDHELVLANQAHKQACELELIRANKEYILAEQAHKHACEKADQAHVRACELELIRANKEYVLAEQAHKQAYEKADQAHRHACGLDTVKTDNEIRLDWEKAKIRLWEKSESRKLDQSVLNQWRTEYEAEKKPKPN